jgi:hypothetical protein
LKFILRKEEGGTWKISDREFGKYILFVQWRYWHFLNPSEEEITLWENYLNNSCKTKELE